MEEKFHVIVGKDIDLTQADFRRLVSFMYDNYGIDLTKKYALVKGRLSTSLQKKGYASFKEYIDYILSDQGEAEVPFLVSRLTTNYTYFLREKKHYDFMTERALPELTPRIRDHDLRIWSAGCSSGEEPYSIAMVLDDYFGKERQKWDKVILASDISEKVLNLAKAGVYDRERLSGLPKTFVSRYFTKVDEETVQIAPALRKEVAFRKFNLMEPFRFKKKFHIIFCRNVMIYFDLKTRTQVIQKYYDALDTGGYLFIGLSETLANISTRFKYIEPSIYQK